MSSNDLDTLLKIRNSREELARHEVANQKHEVLQQHKVLREKTGMLHSFQNWKKQEESNLLQAIQQQPVPPAELQSFRNSLTSLIQRQQRLNSEVVEQQQTTEQAEQTLAEAKVKLVEKNRAAEKCRELISDEKELSELEASFLEESEMEETALTQWIFARKAQDQGAP
jgi:prophage antirepressor-like protein